MFLPSSVSTPSDTFLQAPVDNIHTYKGKHKGTHLYTQVHSQRHKKECTQAQGYSGTLRGIRAWGHTKTPSVTHILAHLSTFTVKATHVYIHSCRTLERSQMFSQVSTVRHTHRVSPARRCSHHHPLQPSRLNSLSTHFPPSSGASGPPSGAGGGDGAGFALLMWQLRSPAAGRTLSKEKGLKEQESPGGINRLPPTQVSALVSLMQKARPSEGPDNEWDLQPRLQCQEPAG